MQTTNGTPVQVVRHTAIATTAAIDHHLREHFAAEDRWMLNRSSRRATATWTNMPPCSARVAKCSHSRDGATWSRRRDSWRSFVAGSRRIAIIWIRHWPLGCASGGTAENLW